jgi:hypothetical protein
MTAQYLIMTYTTYCHYVKHHFCSEIIRFHHLIIIIIIIIIIIKAIPVETWTGPEGSRRLRLPDFKTIDT